MIIKIEYKYFIKYALLHIEKELDMTILKIQLDKYTNIYTH